MLKPNVSHCINENEVHYNPIIHDYSKDYLTFRILSDGDIVWKESPNTNRPSSNALYRTILYKLNDGEWTEITSTNEGVAISVKTGDKILFKGENATYALDYDRSNKFGDSTCRYTVEGNIMSLISGDNFADSYELTEPYTFDSLFASSYGSVNHENPNLISAEKLILSATTLTYMCYDAMFFNCSNLTTTPKLPATTLADSCYYTMFESCTSLTLAPELPATTLAESCYWGMFMDCTGLIIAPELPSTTLALGCYEDMFYGCTSLVNAPELTATTLAEECYNSMFYDCTNLVNAPELPATTLAEGCYGSMFKNCTSLVNPPELPATTLAASCYSNMFYGCTSLTVAPELPATTLIRNCYSSMFSQTNILPDCSNIDFTSDVVVSSGGLRGLFSGTKVTDSDLDRLLPKNNGKYCLPVMALANYCYISMFENCTNLTTAPELPATTLVQECYSYMFNGCTSLNYIKAMFTTTPSTNYTNRWVNGVASSGTFIKNAAASWDVSGVHAVPTGWTIEKVSA